MCLHEKWTVSLARVFSTLFFFIYLQCSRVRTQVRDWVRSSARTRIRTRAKQCVIFEKCTLIFGLYQIISGHYKIHEKFVIKQIRIRMASGFAFFLLQDWSLFLFRWRQPISEWALLGRVMQMGKLAFMNAWLLSIAMGHRSVFIDSFFFIVSDRVPVKQLF